MLNCFIIISLFLQSLVVNVSEFPPCVIKTSNGEVVGFDIDLWKALSKELNIKTSFKLVSFDQIFSGFDNNESQAAIAGISITAKREENLDFTHHYLDSGLSILTNKTSVSDASIISFTIVKSFSWLILLLFFGGLVVWLIERKKGNVKKPTDGMQLAFASATTIGYGEFYPKTNYGRIVCFIIFVGGAICFGNFISSLTAEKTITKLSAINSPKDLSGKSVATIGSTTSVESLKNYNANIIECKTLEECLEKLLSKSVDAIVYDTPSILHLAKNSGNGKVEIAGNVFDKQFYAIALPTNSNLREPINRALLTLQENGIYDSIYKKWFGDQ